jgi:hypothetical protein
MVKNQPLLLLLLAFEYLWQENKKKQKLYAYLIKMLHNFFDDFAARIQVGCNGNNATGFDIELFSIGIATFTYKHNLQ